jgi:hypothetical protein
VSSSGAATLNDAMASADSARAGIKVVRCERIMIGLLLDSELHCIDAAFSRAARMSEILRGSGVVLIPLDAKVCEDL